ncbi:MAG: hypothetical protein ACRC8S_03805 [Fimbriiglobus sp.]
MTVTLEDVTLDQLKAKLLTLSETERRRLRDALRESLRQENDKDFSDEDIAQMNRRIEESQKQTENSIPLDGAKNAAE